ncbi:chitin deacetylase 1 [Cylas formicarius]|uniref:chitin deacetylase 1 n=1 Tax=Cylas formicarius TaxID=197179 RepID=UPI002958B4A8|nr:chitin deacetylase 1 [Cylas formicarius]
MMNETNSFLNFVFLSFFICAACETTIKCIENERFYRNPDLNNTLKGGSPTNEECAKYYLCLEGEVFSFKCSPGLLFDVSRQICDISASVKNCQQFTESGTTSSNQCPDPDYRKCEDGAAMCIPGDYFCDGAPDCPDRSDETRCDHIEDVYAAQVCDPTKCQLPKCFCSVNGNVVPGGLAASAVPQIVLLTFEDAVDEDNFEFYSYLFSQNYTNPNGCPISATFFVSHPHNNYYYVQKLWNAGHEIAVHSITHKLPDKWWSDNATLEDWFDEMVGGANILHKFSKIRLSDIAGVRAPFLRIGWNRQFLMMKEFGFLYDSSIVAPFSQTPLWPYTLDYKMPHKCYRQRCPTRSYPGLWQMVINQLEAGDVSCATLDSCPSDLTGQQVYEILTRNFDRHYGTNRAPFGLHFQASWFDNDEYLTAFQDFLDNVLSRPDVWFVTNSQAIRWMQDPVPIARFKNFHYWRCDTRNWRPDELACLKPETCKLFSRAFREEIEMQTCGDCPKKYPWVKNEFGLN